MSRIFFMTTTRNSEVSCFEVAPQPQNSKKSHCRRLSNFLILIFFLVTLVDISAVPDSVSSEKDLKETMYFLKVINTGISNFGNKDHIKRLELASELHFRGHLYFISQKYSKTYEMVRQSQKVLKELYFDFLKKQYFDYTKFVLKNVSPKIILTRDKYAGKFIKLGFRDLSEAKKKFMLGENSNKFLYSQKIHFYIEAMKLARRAKRYAFLAVVESNTPIEDKAQFHLQTIDEFFNPNEEEKTTDYQRVKIKLTNFIERGLVKNDLQYFLNHFDNYGYIQKKDILKNHRIALENTDWSNGPADQNIKVPSGTSNKETKEKEIKKIRQDLQD